MKCLKSIREWMEKQQTMKLMQIVIYMRMMGWIEGGELTHLDVLDEDGGIHVQMAIIEQDKIG